MKSHNNINSRNTSTDLQFVPGLQGVQFTEAFAALKNPASHCLHDVDAFFELNEPEPHKLQYNDPPSLLYESAENVSCIMLMISSINLC